ncbi:MAG: preprotein translocase subunit SecG [Bacteroidetes bacterium]|nr:preprotein translocase subunit SecG [Bacteroidota bacterium]
MGLYVFISVLILITCILIGLIVLVQNSKGGGLASSFASSNQIMGVRKTADFLEKATWTLAVVLLFLSLVSVFAIPRNNQEGTLKTELSTENATAPINAATQAPAQQKPAQEKPSGEAPVK